MQFINYFFASVISFFGLAIGTILVKTAPEEQKPLQKYFFALRKILLLGIFVFLFFYYFENHFYMLTLFAYFLFLLFIEYKINDSFKKSMIIYSVLGILFFLRSKNTNLFTIESSLILLYGLPTASLICSRKEKSNYKLIFYNLGFIIISNLLFFI